MATLKIESRKTKTCDVHTYTRRKQPASIQTWKSWQSLIVCLYIKITWAGFETGWASPSPFLPRFSLPHQMSSFFRETSLLAICFHTFLSAKHESLGFWNFTIPPSHGNIPGFEPFPKCPWNIKLVGPVKASLLLTGLRAMLPSKSANIPQLSSRTVILHGLFNIWQLTLCDVVQWSSLHCLGLPAQNTILYLTILARNSFFFSLSLSLDAPLLCFSLLFPSVLYPFTFIFIWTAWTSPVSTFSVSFYQTDFHRFENSYPLIVK